MLTKKKLLTLKERTRIRKISMILSESAHAIKVAIDEALKCKETGEEKTILFGLTGTGYFDMMSYQKFNDGIMSDYIPTDAEIKAATDLIPRFEGNEF